MEILEAFVFNDSQHPVNIRWEGNKPLFRASEIADILEIKQIRSSIRDFDEDERVCIPVLTPGGVQETLFLTEDGVYSLLMISRKKVAKPFKKWVKTILRSISSTGKYEVDLTSVKKEVTDNIRVEYDTKLKEALQREAENTKKQIRLHKSDTIIESFKDRYVVYFAIVHDIEEDVFIIKIGSTKTIDSRALTLQNQFGLFDVFKAIECPHNEQFEKFLHNHDRIKPFKYKFKGSNETFKVTSKDIDTILKIATHNKFKFCLKVEYQDLIELEKIKVQNTQLKVEELKLQKELKIEETPQETSSDNEEDSLAFFIDERRHTQVRGEKIQRYSPNGKTLIKTYESYAYAIRDNDLPQPTRCGIKSAIANNSIYKGYRWTELKRDLADDTVQTLQDTIVSVSVRKGFVAMLNLDKNMIVKVFCDQKAAAEDRKFKGCAAISAAITRESQSGGHYFKMWFDCSKELQDKYLEHNQLPEKKVLSTHKQVQQLHPATEEYIKTFSSTEEVIKQYKLSRTTLKNAVEYNLVSKGFRWRFL